MNSSDKDPLKYTDETDKCFGLAGMAISLVVWDASELLSAINLDAPVEEALRLTPDYYLGQSGRSGAKAAWEQDLKRFQLTAAMTIANVCSRRLVRRSEGQLSRRTLEAILTFLNEEGAMLCQLEPDEVQRITSGIHQHCTRIFNHSGVCTIASQLASQLTERRSMQAAEVLDLLAPLNRM